MAQTAIKGYEMFVGGDWVPSASGETQEVLNPATGDVIAEVPRGSDEDVDRAVKAARKAFDDDWFDTTPGERGEMLMKLAARIEENAVEFVDIESANVGKPRTVVADEEMPATIDNLRFFASGARFLEGRAAGEYMRGYTSILRREPVGVVGSIAPWNYPLMMAVWKFSPALAAGKGQGLKPSEQTPLTLLRFMELAEDVIPPGI